MNVNARRIGAAAGAAMLALYLAACSALSPVETRELDARFGDAVRQARAQQTLNPQAGLNTDPVTGIDGVAAQHTIEEYQKSFKEPPRTFGVLGIGGTTISP